MEKGSQPEVIEVKVEPDRPRDWELESAILKLKSKLGKAERTKEAVTPPDRGGGCGVNTVADGLEF